jgi:tetratricopeptide (TPR) repeat protein
MSGAAQPPVIIEAPKAVFKGPPPPDPGAVAEFQAGMSALQRHDYEAASGAFSALLSNHPGERALLDRARVYLEICQRELARRPVELRTLEERLTAATAALNNGQEARAEQLARGVLAEDPRHDLALYLLASLEARRGDADKALSYLGQAIAISPEARAQARHEPDFESIRDLDAFRELTDLPAPGTDAARRPRRGRPER